VIQNITSFRSITMFCGIGRYSGKYSPRSN
jgi:hypothetical protein